MTLGTNEQETTTKNDKQKNGKTNGNAEPAQTAGEKGKVKLVSGCGSLKSNTVNDEVKQTSRVAAEQQSDDIYELPTLLNLVIQSYEGETCEDQFHGEGVAYFEGGHVYKGMFTNGLMNGLGEFTWEGGMKYEGEFVCNIPMGKGTYTWPNGSCYKGEVYSGARHGTGAYKCAKNGVSYRGQWDHGKRHGKGTIYYNQDKTSWYRGDWVKNNREGLGVRCYPSGNNYSGGWKNNLRHGEGRMRWLKLGQQYDGMWQDGFQHGRGTHVWILRRADGSQYSQSNRYTGEFIQGQRHGQGAFYYADGAIYHGEWKNNKKHGKGKFTFKDGHAFEGEFVDDKLMRRNLNRNRAPAPLCGQDMALKIECVLDKIPEKRRDTERQQVEFVLLRNDTELQSLYRFYSRLGHGHSKDNIFQLSRLQLWRLLKDCNIHHHDISLAQVDHFVKDDTTTEIHSPFTPVPFQRLLSCLVIVAYNIYSEDMVSEKYHLAACLSKLMTDDILPNAKNVNGFLFGQPGLSAVAMNHMKRCWEVYQAHCRVHTTHRDGETITNRHLLWMFKDLCLLDNNLTTAKLLKIIAAESRDLNNLSSCLGLEITFLEFFEVLVGCAEVKCQPLSERVVEQCQLLSTSDAETKKDHPEVEDSEKIFETTNSPPQSVAAVETSIGPEVSSLKLMETEKASDTAELPTDQDVIESQQDVETEVSDPQPQSAEVTGVGEDMQTRGTEAKHQTVHQFLNHFFFPAFDYHQLVTKTMKEDKISGGPKL